jgi:hypothetical protein
MPVLAAQGGLGVGVGQRAVHVGEVRMGQVSDMP